ncbi:uncharacterized protein BP5553_07084 [Venustampulla echinocandica]|uniref:Uncharacterized protein n=1 Tax=Venustampulla echinocandica TaxID=2656787 RepID=A0A370TIG8_9HELO|nr:uncharacterized protein BP5553_07084 [Venustampulla echinocandica]RDL35153.1 hypothetical protein BP5553_07084 [Venustampulla echinocandica]
MPMFASTFRWLQRKRYQYESKVTFSLYMLTPTEKFIFSSFPQSPHYPSSCPPITAHFNSFLFLFFSMVIIALTLYLPHHLTFLTNRAWFYYNGDESAKSSVNAVLNSATTAIAPVVGDSNILVAPKGL